MWNICAYLFVASFIHITNSNEEKTYKNMVVMFAWQNQISCLIEDVQLHGLLNFLMHNIVDAKELGKNLSCYTVIF